MRQTGSDTHEIYCAAGCIVVTSRNNQILAEKIQAQILFYMVMETLPLSHTDIPLSIMKLSKAIMIPNRARNTQSSPNLAKVCLHRNEIALASFP